MLIEAEVITYGDQNSSTDNLVRVRIHHDLDTTAKIQVLIACSTDKSMSPYQVRIIPHGS